MKVIDTSLPGCKLIEPQVFGDSRGAFYESWNKARWAQHGLDFDFVQSNVSMSERGVLRGLHYQWPQPQGKLVSVLEGEVYDVAVDIRRGSADFGRWTAAILSAENKREFWIPEGFAHGFMALQDHTHFQYKTTDVYARDCERAIAWNDSRLHIAWPDPLQPSLAAKDAAAPTLAAAEVFE